MPQFAPVMFQQNPDLLDQPVVAWHQTQRGSQNQVVARLDPLGVKVHPYLAKYRPVFIVEPERRLPPAACDSGWRSGWFTFHAVDPRPFFLWRRFLFFL